MLPHFVHVKSSAIHALPPRSTCSLDGSTSSATFYCAWVVPRILRFRRPATCIRRHDRVLHISASVTRSRSWLNALDTCSLSSTWDVPLRAACSICLYTSDAADERSSVD